MNDFEKVDKEAEEISKSIVSVDNLPTRPTSNMMEYRKELIKKYHGGAVSLIEKLTEQGKNNSEMMVLALVDELIQETDHLMGNELIASEQGDIRDSSVISAKRADVLEKAIKAVQTKQEFDKENGIDINSPIIQIIFRYFMKKVKTSFELLGYSVEASDVFFQNLSIGLKEWEKELQNEIDDLNVI